MSNSPVRFAIVGCGTIAPTHAEALAALPEGQGKLIACCDTVPEKANAFAQKFGIRTADLQSLLTDPHVDALSICTPSGTHGTLGAAGLRAGKYVIVEKPMEVTPEACDLLLSAQAETGKTLAVVSQHRFDPASRRVHSALKEKMLGGIILADARIDWYRTQEYYDSGDWRGTWAMDGGGCLMNQGVHTIDLLLWFCGEVQTVYAQTRTAAHARIEVEDVVAATVAFRNGAIATISASTAAYPGFPARLSLYGTQGSVVIEGDTLQSLTVMDQLPEASQAATSHALQVAKGGTRAATEQGGLLTAESEPGAVWGDAHRAQLADFIHCCRTGEAPLVDGVQGRKSVELICAIYQSARTGQAVQFGA